MRRQWLGLAALIAIVAVVVLWPGRVLHDFWPVDASTVGPNLVASVAQGAIVLTVAALIYPPLRRRLEAWWKSERSDLHAKLDAHDTMLRHIIKHHPDIPDLQAPGENTTPADGS
jgi:hypothetical protein